MYGRLRLLAACAALAAAATLTLPAVSGAWTTTDVNWGLSESWTTYGGGLQFHIGTTGDGAAYYRWLDNNLTRTTIISGNSCADYNLYGQATIGGGDTDYHRLFSAGSGACFVLRGHTPSGSGSTIPHDGRLRR